MVCLWTRTTQHRTQCNVTCTRARANAASSRTADVQLEALGFFYNMQSEMAVLLGHGLQDRLVATIADHPAHQVALATHSDGVFVTAGWGGVAVAAGKWHTRSIKKETHITESSVATRYARQGVVWHRIA